MPRERTVTTGELADELGVSTAAVRKWARDGVITPTMVTPGGHYRWHVDSVRAELTARRRRDDVDD